MHQLNEKFYERFAPAERIRLATAALSRNDDAEIARLRKTCPKKEYSCTDNSYVQPMETITHISMQFAGLCQLFNGKATACDLLIFTFTQAINYERQLLLASEELEYAKSQAPNLGVTNTIDEHKLEKNIDHYLGKLKELHAARNENVACLKALHQAFLGFCKEIGIDSGHLLAWLELPQFCDNFEKYLASEVEADQDFKKQVQEQFLASWREMVG